MPGVFMLSVVMLIVVRQNVIMLSVVLLIVVRQNVIMLIVFYTECHNLVNYAECLYDECCYAECHHAECRDAKFPLNGHAKRSGSNQSVFGRSCYALWPQCLGGI